MPCNTSVSNNIIKKKCFLRLYSKEFILISNPYTFSVKQYVVMALTYLELIDTTKLKLKKVPAEPVDVKCSYLT